MIYLYGLVLFVVVSGSLLYWSRAHWYPSFADTVNGTADWVCDTYDSFRDRVAYTRLPTSFAGDAEAGLSSATFDLAGNVEGGDSRAGLDDASKAEILKIMKRRRLPFDEARRVYMEQRFQANGIGADGRPRDPKFVSFS